MSYVGFTKYMEIQTKTKCYRILVSLLAVIVLVSFYDSLLSFISYENKITALGDSVDLKEGQGTEVWLIELLQI